MDSATLNNITESCREELSLLFISSGLEQLKIIARYCSDSQILTQVEEIVENYQSMLNFLAKGGKDKDRTQTQDEICRKAQDILRIAHRDIRLQTKNDMYSKAFHELRSLYGTEQEEALLEKWGTNMLPEEQLLTQDHLFLHIWTSSLWTQKQTAQWYEFLSRQTDNVKIHLLGAVFLSIWEYFDAEKLSLLFYFTDTENRKLNALSVTTLLFLAEKYKQELIHHPNIYSSYQEKHVRSHIIEVITEKMRMHQTLIALKEEENIISSFSLSMSQEEMNQLMERKINHLQRMIADGLDINLSNRMALWNRSDFLRDNISHWWIPFEKTSPAIQDLLLDKNGNFKEKSYKMLDIPNECDIDQYAIYSYMAKTNIKNNFLDILAKGFEEMEQSLDGDIYIEVNHYKVTMQNLYRIFAHSPLKNQIDNPFSWQHRFWENPIFQIQFTEKEHLHIIHAMEASQFHTEVVEWVDYVGRESGFDYFMLEKKASNLMKLEKEAQAIEPLTQMLFLDPDNKDALLMMQECYKRLGKREKEMECITKLLEANPEDKLHIKNAANALMKLKRYEEALSYLFKLDYLDPGNPICMQNIEKCAFMLRKFDVSLRYGHAVLEIPDLKYKEVEYMNIGHVYLVQGDWQKALEYYRKFVYEFNRSYENSKFKPKDIFLRDKEILIELGVSLPDFHLIFDMIRFET